MKKLLSLLLVLSMLLSLAACGSKPEANTPGTNESAAQDKATAPAEQYDVQSTKEWNADAPTGFKIGFAYMPPSDTLGAAFRRMFDYVSAEFGCEMVYVEWTAFDVDSLVASYENLIQAGCQAIVPVVISAPIVEMCNKNGVYFLPTCCEVQEELLPMCLESDYYLGNIHEDEIAAGYMLGQTLYDAGCRNVIFKGSAPGNSKGHDDRHRGFKQFAEEHEDFNIVVESLDSTNTAIFDELIAAHGTKIDGIAASGGNAALPAAIIAAGYENDIKYTTIDIQGDVRTDLELGMCVGVACGQYSSMELAFLVIYNALATGEKVIVERDHGLLRSLIWMTNAEEYDNYITYLEGSVPAYTGDELKEMSLAHNPDATVESVWQLLQDYSASYGLEDVVERHAEFF